MKWEIKKDGDLIRAIGPLVADDNLCAVDPFIDCTDKEAALAAAAPEMLEALEKLMAGHCVECACGLDVSPRKKDTDMATAVIKKAKGETE